MLSTKELSTVLDELHKHLHIKDVCEFTLECNPDDIKPTKLKDWKGLHIDRLSIGIQSFNDKALKLLNRSHSAMGAQKAIEAAYEAGFEKLTADLIFGIPGRSTEQLEEELKILLSYQLGHFSAYSLTIEPKTLLAHQIANGKIDPVSDDIQLEQFELVGDLALDAGFQRYEISNYAIPGNEAVHNSNYWTGKAYLGIGPSAHSFKEHSRRWNVSSNHSYLKSIQENRAFWEDEFLTIEDRFNEYLMTRLRTHWGLDLKMMQREYPNHARIIERQLHGFLQEGLLERFGNSIKLSKKGLFLSDHITSELMILEDED